MEFRNTLEVLHANAEEIKQLMARLEMESDVSAIELDLILEKLRNIYDLVLDMQNTIGTKTTPEIENTQEKESMIALVPESAEDKIPEQKPQDRKVNTRIQMEQDLKREDTQHEEKIEKSTFVSDRFKTSRPSLNEEMAAKAKAKDLTSHLKPKPGSTLANALGLNEKFELVNELFGGDREKFEQVMQELNTAGSFVEAYNYLNETFNWDMDNVYVQRILELIRRKLIVKRNEQ